VGKNDIPTIRLRFFSTLTLARRGRSGLTRTPARFGRLLAAALLATMAMAQPADAAFYPLELTNIKPVGAYPNGLDANNRIYRAYPGLEYNIRAAVIGGDYPFTYSLNNAPAGMTINSATGEISWLNPQGNASPTIVVRDAAGAQVSATWPITVTASGFVFIDAVNGRNAANNGCSSSCGTGTASNPWRTIKDMYMNAPVNSFTYFRNGTYTVLDIPRTGVGGVWERVEFTDKSNVWLAYPGQSPRIDFSYTGGGAVPLIRFVGPNVYVDGFETLRSHLIGFQVGNVVNRGSTFRNLNMHDTGPGVDGTNASFIMYTQNYPNQSYGNVIHDSTFCRVTGHAVTVKTYSAFKMLIESTTHCNTAVGLELKSDTSQFTVRGNTFRNFTGVSWQAALGGNMHMVNDHTYGEISFNNILNPGAMALFVNQDGQAREVYVHRNTLVGNVQINAVDTSDGPFRFSNNVIVNNASGTPSGSRITFNNVTVPTRVTISNNLTGTPSNNIVDANGNLTPAYSGYIGTHGHMLGDESAEPPAPPSNLRIIS
jgi:hypothetical protein